LDWRGSAAGRGKWELSREGVFQRELGARGEAGVEKEEGFFNELGPPAPRERVEIVRW
jgi:hypothetical protein